MLARCRYGPQADDTQAIRESFAVQLPSTATTGPRLYHWHGATTTDTANDGHNNSRGHDNGRNGRLKA